ANVENNKRAAGFAAQAVQRAASATERERMWISAWAKYHQITDAEQTELQSGDAERIKSTREAIGKQVQSRDEKKLARDLVRDLEAIVAKYPDEAEPKAFLIVQIWRNTEFGLEISSHGAVDALLDQLFAQAPMHPAQHFRIHLWDHEKPVRALQAAALIGHTAPGIAHQWHMSGHIFADLDRHADAAWQQEAAGRVDHAFMARDRVLPYEIHNYGHNQEWLCRSLMHVGRAHDAVELAKNMIELPRHPVRNKIDHGEQIAGYGRQRLLDALEAFECWDEVLRCADGGWLESSTVPREQLQRLRLCGIARFRLGRPAGGEAVLAEVDKLLQQLRGERATAVDRAEDEALQRSDGDDKQHEAMDKALREQTDVLRQARNVLHELRGEQALATGDGKQALEQLQKAPQAPPWTLALAHQQLGEHEKALTRLQAALKPGRVAPLARQIVALHAAGKLDEAQAQFTTLRTLAGAADLDAPLLQRLSPIAGGFGWPADWRTPAPAPTDVGERPPLDSLGPFRWQPVAAPPLDLPLTTGGRFDLAARRGKPTLLVFYLGFGCKHCIAQLQAFAPKSNSFAAAGIDLIAIGTEAEAKVTDHVQAMADAERLPFPLACDPELAAFKAYRAYDDFEAMPLHSTVLVDGQGRIRWQDISFEPFKEVDWLLLECQRLLQLPVGGVGDR
ncbi:MAG TPA: redoxin domain-containing protein, partial [Planctomycetota bacterium]|nr:redoxin domain-containing protein [Planctomycetota bacterium]